MEHKNINHSNNYHNQKYLKLALRTIAIITLILIIAPTATALNSPENYNLTFNVQDEAGENIVGAEVHFFEMVNEDPVFLSVEETDENGEVVFEELEEGDYLYNVGREGYADNANFLEIKEEDVTEEVTLIESDHKVTFYVIDKDTGENIENALIFIVEEEEDRLAFKNTDGDGEAVFEMEEGDYEYAVLKEGYEGVDEESLEVHEDMNVTVELELEEIETYDLTFNVQDGEPIEGATVGLWLIDDPYGPPVFVDGKVTGEAGEVVFEELEEGDYLYNVGREGYADNANFLEIKEEDVTEEVTLIESDHKVTFYVIDKDTGENIENALIFIVEEEEDRLAFKNTDGDGEAVFEMEEGDYEYAVLKEGYEGVDEESLEVHEDMNVTVELELEEIETYDLTFNVQDGEPIEGAEVHLHGHQYHDYGVTDEYGEVVFEDVPEGHYDYHVEKEGFAPEDGVIEADEDKTVNVTLEEFETYDITFNVQDEGEENIEGAIVILYGVGSEETDENGVAVFEGFSEGVYSYDVEREGYMSEFGEVKVSDDTEVEVTLKDAPYTITFKVQDEEEEAIEGAGVHLERVSDQEGEPPEYVGTEETDGAGEAVFWVPPDNYHYNVSMEGYVDEDGHIEVIDSDVVEPIDLADAPYTITLELKDEGGQPIAHTDVKLLREVNGDYDYYDRRWTDDVGVVEFWVPADNYLCIVEGYAGEHEIEVADEDVTETLTLEEVETYKLTFEVRDEEDDPIEGATVHLPVGHEETDEHGVAVLEDVPVGAYDYDVVKEGFLPVSGEVEIDEDKTVEVTLWDEDLEPQINALRWDGSEPAEDTSVYYNYYNDGNNVQFVVENAPFADNVFADFSHLGGETVWADEDDGVWKFNWDWDLKDEYGYPDVHHIYVYMEPGWEEHPIGHFIVVNINPLDMDFGLGGDTTNWRTEIDDFTEVEDLAFEMGDAGTIGKLVIDGPINLCDENTAYELHRLGEHLKIAHAKMSLDTAAEALAEFEGPATLHMYDLPFVETPSILYIPDESESEVVVDDGSIIDEHLIDHFEWDGDTGTITLEVNEWSTYKAFVEGSSFVVSDFTVSPETVQPEETAMVSAVITNWGDNPGERDVEFIIDDESADSETIELYGGESKSVSFEVSREETGVYDLMINAQDDDEAGTFTVRYIPDVELSPVENFENTLVPYDLAVTNPPEAENAIENVTITPPPDFDDHAVISAPENWEGNIVDENRIIFSTDNDPIESGKNLTFEFESKTPVLTGDENKEYLEWIIETKDEENLLLTQKYATSVFSVWHTHEGYAHDLDGNPIENAEIRVEVERPYPRRFIERWDTGRDIITAHYADSGEDGYFKVENIPPGIRFRTEAKYFEDDRLIHIAQRPVSISEDIFTDLGEVHYYMEKAATVNLSVEEFGHDSRDNFFYGVTDRATSEGIVMRTFVQESENIYLSAERSYMLNVQGYALPGAVAHLLDDIKSDEDWQEDQVINLELNVEPEFKTLTGYVEKENSDSEFDNLSIIPYYLEGEDTVVLREHDGVNKGGAPDNFNPENGYYEFSRGSSAEGEDWLLFFTAIDGEDYYGGLKSITLYHENDATIEVENLTLQPLEGDLTHEFRLDNFLDAGEPDEDPATLGVSTKLRSLRFKGAESGRLEGFEFLLPRYKVDYSEHWDIDPIWWIGPTGHDHLTYALPMFDNVGVELLEVYSSDGMRKTSLDADEMDDDNIIIEMFPFDPRAIDPGVEDFEDLKFEVYINDLLYNVPNPDDDGLLWEIDEADFHPMTIMLGGGDISFRMINEDDNIIVHYNNVNLLRSGPPDALFDTEPEEVEFEGTMADAWRFGTMGPDIYDDIILGMPYDEPEYSEIENFAIRIRAFYDDDWNEIWNIKDNTVDELPGEYSEYGEPPYDKYVDDTQDPILASDTDEESIAYVDTENNMIWMRIPHFSGVNPSVILETVDVEFELTMGEPVGEGSVVPEAGTHEYVGGAEVTIEAIPDEGWEFVEWTGDVDTIDSVYAASTTITMDENKDITAVFEEEEYTLTFNIEGDGAVTDHEDFEFSDGETKDYTQMTEVTLTADADEHWYFDEWTGDESGTEETLTFDMDGDKEITANFEKIEYDLTISVEGEGTTDPEPGTQNYDEDIEVTLTATPDEGWEFDGWIGDMESEDSNITVTMDEDKSVTANFEEEPEPDPTPEPTPDPVPEFEVSDFAVNPDNIEPGVTIEVSADITNIGEEAGERDVEFLVDGEVVDSVTIELDEGESTSVSFEVTREEEGSYGVTIDAQDHSMTGSFIIEKLPLAPTPGVIENMTPDEAAGALAESDPDNAAKTLEKLEPEVGGSILNSAVTENLIEEISERVMRMKPDNAASIRQAAESTSSVAVTEKIFEENSSTAALIVDAGVKTNPIREALIANQLDTQIAATIVIEITGLPETPGVAATLLVNMDLDRSSDVVLTIIDNEEFNALIDIFIEMDDEELNDIYEVLTIKERDELWSELSNEVQDIIYPDLAPTFEITNLSIKPLEMEPGENALIQVNVMNIGGTSGTYPLEVIINGETEFSEEVTLSPEYTENFEFTVTREEEGEYIVEAGELVETLNVKKPFIIPVRVMIAIAVVIAIIIPVTGIYWKTRQSKKGI